MNHRHLLITRLNLKEVGSMWHLVRFSCLVACATGLLSISVYPAIGATGTSEPARPVAAQSNESSASHERTEIYMGLFMMGNFPGTRALKFENDPYPNTEVGGGLGGGLKVGMYPALTNRIIGVEAELTGFNAKVDAPQTMSGGVSRRADFRLNVFNAMANLMVRYPGDVVQPYGGIGVGLSGGFARGLNVQNSSMGTINENAADGAFAYQVIGGARVNLSERFFLFSEYKYFVANYKWESELPDGSAGPSFSLPFRTHIVAGGVGFNF
jgi:opacity protein-like surface antigen